MGPQARVQSAAARMTKGRGLKKFGTAQFRALQAAPLFTKINTHLLCCLKYPRACRPPGSSSLLVSRLRANTATDSSPDVAKASAEAEASLQHLRIFLQSAIMHFTFLHCFHPFRVLHSLVWRDSSSALLAAHPALARSPAPQALW